MKKILIGFFTTGYFLTQLQAQQKCSSGNYLLHQMQADPSLQNKIIQLEEFTRQRLLLASPGNIRTNTTGQLIKIPVVFHVLYHQPGENISDLQIQQQIDALNRDFRKRNADTSKTPDVFVPVAADMEIEFQLAKSAPRGGNTTGIVRKYTPVKSWMSDDKVKFNNEYGDEAWDSNSYLNIWVCNLQGDLGYSTFPGGDAGKDGIVLSYQVVGYGGAYAQYGMGRTCVHEVGHWLNLKHLWGDTYCGDDNVDDTPKQGSYTSGCPTGIRTTCDNAPDGDMYMNYMDFTNDACMNIFTQGQKQRARILFESGGPRYSILFSKALNEPVIFESPLPEFHPQWLYANVYPNPATSQVNIYFEYDARWLGKKLFVYDVTGKMVMTKTINTQVLQLDISKLNAGVYIIRAEKADESIVAKFVKQ